MSYMKCSWNETCPRTFLNQMKIPLKKLKKAIKAAIKDRALRFTGLQLKAEYITTAPSAQSALDVFNGEWTAKLPFPFQDLRAGDAGVFQDPRIAWLGEPLD